MIGGALLLRQNADVVRELPPEVRRMAAYSDYWKRPHPPLAVDDRCAGRGRSADRRAPCPGRGIGLTVLLAGDSHAGHIADALQARFSTDRIVPVITKGCRSLSDGPPSRCSRNFDRAVGSLVVTGKVQAVVLAAQWQDRDLAPLVDTIGMLRSHGVRVTVIGPVVEYDGEFPRILARAMLMHDLTGVDGLRRRGRQTLDRRMALLVRRTGARYYSAYDQECPDGACRLLSSKGEPMHFDYGHYTRSASVDIVAGLPPL